MHDFISIAPFRSHTGSSFIVQLRGYSVFMNTELAIPFEFKGTLTKHHGLLALIEYWSEPVVRYLLQSYITGECKLLPLLDTGSWLLKLSSSGYGYLTDGSKTTQWCQQFFNHASHTNLQGLTWTKEKDTGSKVKQSELFARRDNCVIHACVGIPVVRHSFKVWHFPFSLSWCRLWWSLQDIASALNLAKRNSFSTWVNNHLPRLESYIKSVACFGPVHVRRSQEYGSTNTPDQHRVLEQHTVTTQGLVAAMMRWAGAKPGQGILSSARATACQMLLNALCERGLHGAWTFHVEFSPHLNVSLMLWRIRQTPLLGSTARLWTSRPSSASANAEQICANAGAPAVRVAPHRWRYSTWISRTPSQRIISWSSWLLWKPTP